MRRVPEIKTALVFGCLRLLLAMVVMVSHLQWRVAGLNPGVVAVVVFLILSGHATHHLMTACGGSAPGYLADRALRIFPPYYAAMAVAAACWLALRPDSAFLSRTPGWGDWLANAAVLPLNLFRWTGQDGFTLVPQAWSLALELHFYLVAPLLARARPRSLGAVMGGSLLVWLLACAGVLDPDTWGYRLLPGTLFMFLTGLCIARGLRRHVAGVMCMMAAAAGLLAAGVVRPAPFNAEGVAGLVLGAALVPALARLRPRRLDSLAGTLSYPLFLSHFAVLWMAEAAGVRTADLLDHPAALCAIVAASLALAWAIHLAAERPLAPLRRRIRGLRPPPVLS